MTDREQLIKDCQKFREIAIQRGHKAYAEDLLKLEVRATEDVNINVEQALDEFMSRWFYKKQR